MIARVASLRAERIDTAALKRDVAIEDVVQAAYGIPLRREGRGYVGRCPFHADSRHPNLHVYPAREGRPGDWYCFACQQGGDVIRFVRLIEGDISFRDACTRLGAAPRMHRPTLPARKPVAPAWDRLGLEEQEVMNLTAEHYQGCLWRTGAALAYVRGRGLPDAVIRDCRLGYADGRLFDALFHDDRRLEVAAHLGLVRRGPDGRCREALAGRVVVPEIRQGNVIWFIGRALRPDAARRYVALPGQRQVLGLERAAGQREAFVAEGIFDWLTAVSWDLPACAIGGTHLPPERLGFLARAERIYGLFDADAAGEAASEALAAVFGHRWCRVTLPDGVKDLNDLGRRPRGRETFLRRLATGQSTCHAPTPNGEDTHPCNV